MAENVYSELACPACPERSRRERSRGESSRRELVEGAEPILYYGDNLEILRRYIEDESVDLVHLDPD